MTERPSIFLALPGRSELVSGGAVYNDLIAAPLAGYDQVKRLSFAEASRLFSSRSPGIFLFDSLDMRAVCDMMAGRSDRQAIFLMAHMLPSLVDAHSVSWEKANLPRFDGIVATSDLTASLLRERGVKSENILVLPPGPSLTIDSAAMTTRQAKPSEKPMKALVVANWLPNKGSLELLEALDYLAVGSERLAVSFAGSLTMDVGYAQKALALVARSEFLRDRVHVLGSLAEDKLAEQYRQADVVVSSSHAEAFGMALFDARCFGLPVLALDRFFGARRELGSGGTYFFASVTDLARELMALAQDPSRLRTMQSDAFKTRPSPGEGWHEKSVRLHDWLLRVHSGQST